jgi:acyl-CoA synthetase (AMP-forming)/AMP-acid ligase II
VAALPPEKRPKNQSFASALGMTETSGPHTASPPDLPDDLVGSYGPPMPGMEHRIVDVDTGRDLGEPSIGELWVRGDALMEGMVKRERQDVFQADGWYRTGDLCSFKQGHLFFHGRLDDLIKVSGANVSPREVEEAYSGLPGVTQVLALGLPDQARGAVVGLVLVVGAGCSISEDKLREAASQLASYKRPKVQAVFEASQVPMASSGKADRRALISLLQEKRTREKIEGEAEPARS